MEVAELVSGASDGEFGEAVPEVSTVNIGLPETCTGTSRPLVKGTEEELSAAVP